MAQCESGVHDSQAKDGAPVWRVDEAWVTEALCPLCSGLALSDSLPPCLPLPQVHLYSDPPQPSQSFFSGSMPQGSKVLSFSIPQPRSAEWWPDPAQDPQASEATGELGKEPGLLSIPLLMEDIESTLGTILGEPWLSHLASWFCGVSIVFLEPIVSPKMDTYDPS